MKKLMLLLIVLTNVISAMEDTSEQDRIFLENELAIIENNKKNLAPLTQLCIRQILRNPGHYIEQDAEHKLPFDLHDNIREYWIKHRKVKKLTLYFKEKISLNQLLLLEKIHLRQEANLKICWTELGALKVPLSNTEHAIYNKLPSQLLEFKNDQKRQLIKSYILVILSLISGLSSIPILPIMFFNLINKLRKSIIRFLPQLLALKANARINYNFLKQGITP